MKTCPFFTAGRDHQPDMPAKLVTSCSALWRLHEQGLRMRTSGSNFLTCHQIPMHLEAIRHREPWGICMILRNQIIRKVVERGLLLGLSIRDTFPDLIPIHLTLKLVVGWEGQG